MKNGFSLVELLITIALIAIISIMVVPNVIDTRKQMLEESLEVKYTNIEAAAIKWAMDNLNSISFIEDNSDNNYTVCNYVNVDTLISRGYLVGDKEDKTILENPVTGEELNSVNVCVRYDISRGYENRVMETVIEK